MQNVNAFINIINRAGNDWYVEFQDTIYTVRSHNDDAADVVIYRTENLARLTTFLRGVAKNTEGK